MFDHLLAMMPNERKQYLEDNAAEIRNGTYFRKMTDDEVTAARKEISEDAIKLDELDTQKKDYLADHKEDCRPHKDRLSINLSAVKRKQVTLKGRTYTMKSFEEGKVYVLDGNGIVVEERKMSPSERQADIYTMKTGTDE